MTRDARPMSWGMILAIMAGVGVATGLALGLLGTMFGLPNSMTGAGVGAAIGIVGAILINNRRARLAKRG